MKKRAAALFLCFTLVFSFGMQAFAVTYSDLEGHWAQKYIEDLVAKGLMSGYDDGTIRPENNITVCETLALLSRFYTLDTVQNELIQSDYKDFVSTNVPSSISWAYDEIAVCLAAGIITQSEIKSIDLTRTIQKEVLAMFLVRAMKMEKTASTLKDTALSFADAGKIGDSYKTHVALLVSLGIVNGDTSNNFNPQSSVTRAIVAKMVSVSLEYLQKNGVALTIDSYVGISRQEGIIDSVSGRVISLAGFDGLAKIITIPAEAAVTVNGASKALSSDYTGCYVRLTSSGGNVIKAEIESYSSVKWIQGTLTGSSFSTEVSTIYITDKSGAENSYTVSGSAAITQNGSDATVSSLTKGFFLTARYENNTVTKIVSSSGDASISGTVSQLSFGTTIVLHVTDDSGTKYGFSFSISNVPEITRGSKTITIDRILVGDTVKLAVKNCAVTAISMADNGVTVTGELTSIVNTVSGTSWTIKKSDGTTTTYVLDETVTAMSGTTKIKISDIKVGDTVSVLVYGITISEVTLKSAAVTSGNQISGSVLLISNTDNTITVLTTSGKLIYISASSLRWIIYASTGSSISLSALPVGSQIVAYGEYSGSSNFTAKVMIITG